MRQHQCDGMHEAEGGLGTHQCIGQPVQPAEQRLELTRKVGELGVLFDQASSVLDIGNGQRMGYRLVEQLVVLVPATGPAVELRNHEWLLLLQPTAQHLSKQMMVAIPLPFLVECDEEQVAALYML